LLFCCVAGCFFAGNELKQQGDGAGKKRAQIRELKQQGDGAGEKRAQIKSL